MDFNSSFDIIGPIMVGPSSSHTAGVVSIGKYAYEQFGGVADQVEITLYDSFAETYKGHGTDKAVVGGLLGFHTADLRIKTALDMAQQQGMKVTFHLEEQCPYYAHPNTILIEGYRGDRFVQVGGFSLGGGISKIFRHQYQQVDILLSSKGDPGKRVDQA